MSVTVTDDTVDVAARSWCAIPIISASDLSGLSCRPFCMYQCLTSAVHAARTDSPADVLLARIARRS